MFNITEQNGEKPIDEWFMRKIEECAKKEHGIILKVYKVEQDEKESSA